MRTIVLILLLVSLVSTFVMALMWRQYHSRYEGIGFWVSDMFLQTMALLLITMRGEIADWVSIDLSNTLSVAGLILGLKGLEAFIGIRRSHIHNYVLLVLFAFLHTWFTFRFPDLHLRYLNTATFSLLFFAQCSWAMLIRTPVKMRGLTMGAGLVFLSFSLVCVARIIKFIVSHDHPDDYFQSDLFESAVMIIFLLLIVLVTYSIVLMYSRRLLRDIKSEEEKFSLAFRTAPYGLILTRMSDGLILEMNDGFTAISGYSGSSAMNHTTLGIDFWENESDRKSVVDELLARGGIKEKEFRFRKKSGDSMTGLLSARIIHVNNEDCILSSINDITERKKVEDSLYSALQHLKFHENNSPLAVIECGKDFRITKWSNNAVKIFGWEAVEVLGKLIDEFLLIHDEDMESVSSMTRQILSSQIRNNKIVNRNYRKDGSVVACEWFNSALSDSDGNLISVQSLVQDITQRVTAEEKLMRSQKSLADAERISHSGSWVYDTASDLSTWSDNMYNIFDVDRLHPVELLFSDFVKNRVHPEDREQIIHVFSDALEGKGDYDLIYRIVKNDGRIRYIQSVGEVYRDKDNKPIRAVGRVQDITEQKISNDFLRRSEEKFRNLFENSPLGKTITGLDGFIQVNSSFCNMIGYSAEELINSEWKKLCHPDDLQKTDDVTRLLLSGSRERIRFEKRYIHKDGNIIYTDVSTYLHQGPDGKPQYFIATIIDITERKLLERERFKLLDILDQSINEIYLFYSDTLKFEYVNSGALNNLGYTIEEIRLLTPLDIKPEFDEETFRRHINQLVSGEKVSLLFETLHRRKNGTDYPVEVHLQLFTREEESLFFAIINDITERRVNEQKIVRLNEELEQRVIERTEMLRISQENYREIFEISPVSIWKEDWESVIKEIKRLRQQEGVTDFRSYLEANPSFVLSALDSVKIMDVNPAAITLFGATEKAQLLKSLKVVFPSPDLLPGFVEELMALSSGMAVFESDIALRKLDNEVIYVLLRMVFPPEDSENGIVLMNLTDITFRKKAQQALEESQQKLLVTNMELEAFTYTVSHDLRAPLRAIDGFSKILTEDYMDKLDLEGERVVRVIRDNTRKMGNLIDDLLSFSRLGRSQVNFYLINMESVINSVYNDLVASRVQDNIRFEVSDIHNIVCDRILIRQVWTNLISNAIKFSSGRKKIKISITSQKQNGSVIYSIKDNGVGFDMKYYSKLFGVFERLHSVNEFEGTGVGLAIVEKIIRKHGGNVWAEGKPGIGATFFFSLPITEEVSANAV